MRNSNLMFLALAAAALVSCGKTTVEGTVAGAPDAQIVVKQYDVTSYTVLDTLKTDKDGAFKFTVDVKEAQPEFVYLYYKDTKIASLLLEKGDKAVVEADTLGRYQVSGSAESEKLHGVETDFAAFVSSLVDETDQHRFVRKYVEFYRQSVRYVHGNPFSLTVIPVLRQKIGEYSPIFAQTTDALHFRMACDSLKTVYPESKHVKALEKETVRREQELELETRIRNTPATGFPDIVMPDIKGEKRSLRDVKSKVVLLHFWSSAEPALSLFNNEVLLPIYLDYYRKGLQIYSVCIDPDKVRWASVVNGQNLPWINVNDGKGLDSTAPAIYNVQELPTTIMIVDGQISTASIKGEAGLRKELARILR